MSINKVVFGDQVLMDISNDTVTKDTLMEGVTAHDKTGASIVGIAKSGGKTYIVNALAAKWNEDSDGKYSQTISSSGVTSDTKLSIYGAIVESFLSTEEIRDLSLSMGNISQISTSNGLVTLVCLFDRPSVDINNLVLIEI